MHDVANVLTLIMEELNYFLEGVSSQECDEDVAVAAYTPSIANNESARSLLTSPIIHCIMRTNK